MKTNKLTLYILLILPFLATIIMLFFLPDQIPAHFGMNGQADRWGSKYETFVFPVLNLLTGAVMLVISKLAAKYETSGNNNENLLILLTNICLGIFNLMTFFFLYISYHQVENLSQTPVDLDQLLFAALGIGFILLGNYMPKLRKNGLVGVRTSWSMKNETTWKKCQHFGGISLIIAGILILIFCFLTRELTCVLCSSIILTVYVIINVIYSYLIAKET